MFFKLRGNPIEKTVLFDIRAKQLALPGSQKSQYE